MIEGALVFLQVSAAEGFDGLKRKIFQLRKTRKIRNASSVYRRFSVEGPGETIEVVIEIEVEPTDAGMAELHLELEAVDGSLLMVRNELTIDPEFPIPHQRLLLETFILKMAAEIAPYWEHRVKQEPLQALATKNPHRETVEFLTQGAALITLSV